MGSTTSALTPPTFNGSSTFSSSFQQVLTRAVQLASLPMQQMQNNVNDLTNQQTALTQLENTFQSLDTALHSIGTASAGTSSAAIADPTVASASTSSSALPGTYSIQVDTLGSYTTTLSQPGSPPVTDPTSQNINSAASYTLNVNGTNTTVTSADGSLDGLATAINSSSAGVQATIVNLGSNTSADYRLVVTSTSLAPDSIQLSAGSTPLLTNMSTGSAATYKVNGTTTELSSNSRQVTLAPGLTVTMLNTSSSPDTITVSTSYTGLQNALSSFASAYNAAVDALTAQRGQSGGALSGQSIIFNLTNVLQNISQFATGSGTVASLTDMGLSLDQNGHLSFDAATFSGQNSTAISQFLGNVSSSGFLQSAANALTTVDDMTTGSIETEYAALQDQINNQNQHIQDQQTRITALQNNLTAQLTQADAAIATLQAQKNYYLELFQAQYPSNGVTA
jgi:flagellar hook-associated protein 2